ncbi:hypothetical protein NM688_g8425 [Phlebia brevispora]|uniref:Uncharacterized protein n=1 Tax=Phlebia brevispora TaxID=194682 RepID=A0ACC1RTZ0_9APHY|nr:hypothetical protein NM688_g8425 [Phlebia brevispora]
MPLAIHIVSSKDAVKTKKPLRRRKNKAQDPIFWPRYNEYTVQVSGRFVQTSCMLTSIQDLVYIASLTPLTRIPRCLIPSSDNLKPPTMHYGWLIDETVKQSLLEEAQKKNIADYMYGFHDPDFWENLRRLNPGVQDSDLGEPDLYVDGTLELLVEAILEEMGLDRWMSDHINYVLVPKKITARAFTVYTNHEMHNSPSDEIIERLHVRFGFTGKPRWYADGACFQWGD